MIFLLVPMLAVPTRRMIGLVIVFSVRSGSVIALGAMLSREICLSYSLALKDR